MAKKNEPAPTKRRVTMVNFVFAGLDSKGNPRHHRHEAVDYVHPEHLDAYLESVRANWASVEVADDPEAGPGGYHAAYTLPQHIAHPDAGVTRPATNPED